MNSGHRREGVTKKPAFGHRLNRDPLMNSFIGENLRNLWLEKRLLESCKHLRLVRFVPLHLHHKLLAGLFWPVRSSFADA
jgi:hypothetical protein